MTTNVNVKFEAMEKEIRKVLDNYNVNEYEAEKITNELLDLHFVSHQRELLKSFCKYIDLESRAHPDDIDIDIENHLKIFNCG